MKRQTNANRPAQRRLDTRQVVGTARPRRASSLWRGLYGLSLLVAAAVVLLVRGPLVAVAFARLRGYLSTLRKQGVALLAALDTVIAGQPLYPAFA